MRGWRKKILACLLGFACAFLVLEVSLRIVGVSGLMPYATLPDGPRPEPDESAIRILCLGNSHTEGAAENEHGAYPAQLQKLLEQKAPGRKFQVLNMGRGNWNSSEVLEYVPGYLKKYRPHAVFAMVGEPNAWNYRLFYKREKSSAWLLDRLRLLKTVRLVDLLLRFDPEGEKAVKVKGALLDLPWFEYPTLAMGWVKYLEANPGVERVPRAELDVAEDALRRWTASDLGKERQLALSTLAGIQLFRGKHAQAKATAEQLLALPWRPYDLRLEQALEKGDASLAAVLKELRARAPAAPVRDRFLAVLEGREKLPAADLEFLEAFAAAVPGRLETYRALALAYRAGKQKNKIKTVFESVRRENPFADGAHEFAFGLEVPQSDQLEIGYRVAVPLFTIYENAPGEGARLPVGSELKLEQIEAEFSLVQRWVVSDLRKIVELASDSGARVILQTYPLFRKSGNERWPDTLIRSVAKKEGVALSDTSAFFKDYLKGKDREQFYFKANRALQDDHLNAAGNALIAQLMAASLKELGMPGVE